jgi:hypothetical protein
MSLCSKRLPFGLGDGALVTRGSAADLKSPHPIRHRDATNAGPFFDMPSVRRLASVAATLLGFR